MRSGVRTLISRASRASSSKECVLKEITPLKSTLLLVACRASLGQFDAPPQVHCKLWLSRLTSFLLTACSARCGFYF